MYKYGYMYQAYNQEWEWMYESPFADGREHFKTKFEELRTATEKEFKDRNIYTGPK